MKERSAFFLSLSVLCFAVLVHSAVSQEKGFGLGVILGEPSGISAKMWLNQRTAIDGGLAWSFRADGSFHVHADYLWHFHDAVKSTERFVPYVGIGARLATTSDAVFGARIPIGLLWWPKGAPIDVFAEIVPILDLAPATEFRGNGGIGVRYYFQ